MELIRLNNIRFSYPGRPAVLNGLNFSLSHGDRVGILGPNGSGKSTTLMIAMGLIQPDSGSIVFKGQPCTNGNGFNKLRYSIGYLFQDSDDQLFCPTVAEDVAFGPRNLGLDAASAQAAANRALDSLGMNGYQDRLTYQLSGGEKRLACLAGILAMEPEAVFLDEPSNGIDEEHRVLLEKILIESDLSWAMVSHDSQFVERTCNKIYNMTGGALTLQ